MGNKLYKDEYIQAIAAAIRSKVGGTAKYTVAQMADAIASIRTGGNLQTKRATPSESEQTISSDSEFDGLLSVIVEAISSSYIGSAITRRSSNDLTVSGAKVTAPAGYYANAAEKSISSGSVTVNKPTVNTSGLVTAGATVQPGYISGNPSNNTLQLSTQAGKTMTPTKAQQTAVASGRYTTGAVLVAPIPDEFIVPSGSETKTQNGTYDVTSLKELVVNVAGGGGGLPAGIAAFDYGEITVSSAFTTTRQTFSHKLGVVPDLMIVWHDGNIATTYSMLAAIRGNMFGWRSSAYNNHMAYHANSTTTVTWTNSNSTTYGISNMTATTFQLASSSSSYYWRAGTYKYMAIKFS